MKIKDFKRVVALTDDVKCIKIIGHCEPIKRKIVYSGSMVSVDFLNDRSIDELSIVKILSIINVSYNGSTEYRVYVQFNKPKGIRKYE